MTEHVWTPDGSSIRAFRQCPELFRLIYRLGLRARRVPCAASDARHAGSAFHTALELWFSQSHSDIDLAYKGLCEAWGEVNGSDRPTRMDVAAQLVGYANRWPREDDKFRVVRNETFVEATITAGSWPFQWSGIIDRKVAYPDDSRYVMDTKLTSSWLNQDWLALKREDDSLIGYVALERALGERCDGFVVDGAGLRRQEFCREVVHVPDWKVERWANDIVHTLDEIRRLEDARGLDKPWPVYHNWAYGKPDAEYWGLMCAPDELQPELMKEFEVAHWNPAEVARERKATAALTKLSQ